MRTKSVLATLMLLLLAVLLPHAASGQDNPPTGSAAFQDQSTGGSSSDQGTEGVTRGDWNIQQSIELGYRFTRQYGNPSFYNNLVNIHQGPRALSQDLSVRSMTQTGSIFDNLYVSSFGWGGDPYNGARWNVSKGKAYTFTGNWRRDHNYFDYNLLANPLNPLPTGTPFFTNANVNISPHRMELRRRMTDMALTVLPASPVSFRFEYSRNNMTGPSFSSFHEGTDVLLFQPWNTTLNSYRIGVDFKVLRQTIISYDQYLDYTKNDTDQELAQFAVFTALSPTGAPVPVSLGLPFNIPARQPCATPFLANGTVNPGCSSYEAYTRSHRYRTHQPTEQLTIQSNFMKHVDFVASGRYSSADMTDALNEFFRGVVVRTGVNERQFTFTGPATARRITNDIDAGATVHLSDTWRIPITYHFLSWRTSGNWDSVETVFSPATPAVIGGPIGTPVVNPELFQIFLGNKEHDVQAQVEHDFTKQAGARVGGLFTRRDINHRDFSEAEADVTLINQYTGLVGFWFRPGPLRFNVDAEFSSADNFLTRISPTNQQRYRARLSYNPKPWAVASAYANFWEARNTDVAILFRGRSRNAGITLDVTPNPRFGIDLGYNFNLSSQNSNICYFGVVVPGAVPSTDPNCAALNSSTATSLEVNGVYNDHVHYGSIAFYVRPVKRLTANLGYSVTSSDGHSTFLNVLQPLGPLSSMYHQPLANLAIEAYKNVTLNLGYNYWNYFEGDSGTAALPRNFHANVTTLSFKYAF